MFANMLTTAKSAHVSTIISDSRSNPQAFLSTVNTSLKSFFANKITSLKTSLSPVPDPVVPFPVPLFSIPLDFFILHQHHLSLFTPVAPSPVS